MQTFVPFPDMARCAAVLDDRRLGKQIIECRQIGLAISDPGYGWQHHPAVTMWRGHLFALTEYAAHCNAEWRHRRAVRTGQSPTDHGAFVNMLADHLRMYRALDLQIPWPATRPRWWGRGDVHESHRSVLLAKDPDHYAELDGFGLDWTRPGLDYVWPVREEAMIR